MSGAKALAISIAGVIAATAAAGCGGPQKVTAAELDQKGDAICRELQDKFNQIQAQPPANAAGAVDQTKDLVGAAEDADSSLHDMEPPAALQTPYKIYLDARDQAVDQLKRGQDAAENQDSAAYGAAQQAVVQSAPRRKQLAQSLGFRVCSSNPGAV
jgi:hypothetical protein